MTGQNQDTSEGQLMMSLLAERQRFATDEEFRAFALEAVRRFILDLRRYDIEIALRTHHTGKLTAPDHASPGRGI
jgi:hypothetical protein